MCTTTVELQSSLELDALLGSGRLGVGFLCLVQTVHVGLVMLRMMQIHNLARDVRLESLINDCSVSRVYLV